MPKKLHISIPKLKRHKPKSKHSPIHFISKLTHLFICCKQSKPLSPTMDPYKSYCGHRSSIVINDRMESPRRVIYNSPRLASMMDPPKKLSGPHRFLANPHKSRLIAEEACRGTYLNASPYDTIFAVAMHSSEPYIEFYASMVEVVTSRLEQDLTVDWAYMSDLLGCYCEINDKRAHKYIVRAFMDLVEGLHQILS